MKKLVFGLAATLAAFAGSAHAVYLDFVDEAAGNERGVADGTTINFGGLDVTFTSLSAGAFFAYFDDLDQGKPAGLGVCEVLVAGPGSVCADPSDDNIRAGDAVTLTFDTEVTVSNFSFTDADHDDLNSNNVDTLWIAINDPNAFVQYTFAEAVALVIAGVELIRFAFDEVGNGRQFYVNGFEAEPVPVPTAAPLLLAGLAGLGFAARRKRRH
ncbi:PEP-CTERM sorting domain-containing protein [Hyphococcus sp. DH-69]|uniref:PEP-CTERM sorting domain-containing protein n=1 Tax=Hyphococcus formosus TaxID=3143534 RepID=UPI00398B25EF